MLKHPSLHYFITAAGAKNRPPYCPLATAKPCLAPKAAAIPLCSSLQCLHLALQQTVCACPSYTVGDVSIRPNSSSVPVSRPFMMCSVVLPTKGVSRSCDLCSSMGWSRRDTAEVPWSLPLARLSLSGGGLPVAAAVPGSPDEYRRNTVTPAHLSQPLFRTFVTQHY